MLGGRRYWQQREGGAGLQFEGQGQAVVQAVELGGGPFVFEALLLAQFLAYLPEQQAEHQHDQQQQTALGCLADGNGQRVAGRRRRRGLRGGRH